MVSRDPEFNDGDLERLLALRHYEAGVCGGCGIHQTLAGDKSNYFAFEYHVCNVCKGSDQQARAAAEEAKRLQAQFEDQPALTPRPTDGRHMYIRQLNPMEVAARRNQRAGGERGRS